MCLDNVTSLKLLGIMRGLQRAFVGVLSKSFILGLFCIYRKVAKIELKITFYPSPSFL